jgi:hypothetical protein
MRLGLTISRKLIAQIGEYAEEVIGGSGPRNAPSPRLRGEVIVCTGDSVIGSQAVAIMYADFRNEVLARLADTRPQGGRPDQGGALSRRGRVEGEGRYLFQGRRLAALRLTDGLLITGQNPASSGPGAQALVEVMNRMAK